jgi:hypothetical protein
MKLRNAFVTGSGFRKLFGFMMEWREMTQTVMLMIFPDL